MHCDKNNNFINFGWKRFSFEKSYGALQFNFSTLLNKTTFCSQCASATTNWRT